MSTRKNKQRTYARNRAAVSRRGYLKESEPDGRYILKLVVVIILGSLWLKFHNAGEPGGPWLIGVPIGSILGFFFIHRFEHSEYDRKIWYAILVVVTIASIFLPSGIMI